LIKREEEEYQKYKEDEEMREKREKKKEEKEKVQGKVKAQSLLPAQPARLRKDGNTAGAAQGFQFFWGQDQGQCLHRGRSRPSLWNCSPNNGRLCLLLPLGLRDSSQERQRASL